MIKDIVDCCSTLARRITGCKRIRVDRVLPYLAGLVDSRGDEIARTDLERGDVCCCAGGPPFPRAGVVDGLADLAGEAGPFSDVGVGAAAPAGRRVVGWFVAQLVVEDLVLLESV